MPTAERAPLVQGGLLRAVLLPVALPGHGDAVPGGAPELLWFTGGDLLTGGLVRPVRAVWLAVTAPGARHAPPVPALHLLGVAGQVQRGGQGGEQAGQQQQQPRRHPAGTVQATSCPGN